MKSIRQIEAGAVMGHGQGWYSEFERGQRGATAEELQNLAKLLQVEPSILGAGKQGTC